MKTILVADDDFEQRDLYADLFRSEFEVITANDGADAWEKIQKHKPSLVFTGIQMPRMTGFELITKIQSAPATSFLPIIIFSHLGREEDKNKAQALGVNFMVKGYDTPVKILNLVKSLLTPREVYKIESLKPEDDDRTGFTSI